MHGAKEAKQGSLKGDFYCFLLKCIIIVRAWGQSIHVTAMHVELKGQLLCGFQD